MPFRVNRLTIDYHAVIFQQQYKPAVFYSTMRNELNALGGINATSPLDFCKAKVLTDLAIVNVEIGTDFISRSRYQEASTFAQKLASVGEL